MKATAVELPGVLGGLLLVSAHKPPQLGLPFDDLTAVFAAHRKVILVGDLNCKDPVWGSRLATANGRLLHRFPTSNHLQVAVPVIPTYSPVRRNAFPDVLDVANTKGIVCAVQVFTKSELSSDHYPILVHVVTQHTAARDVRPVVDWNHFGPAFCRQLPGEIAFDSVQLIDEAVAKFDEAVTSSIHLCTRMKVSLTPDYHRIPEEIRLLALEKNRLRRRWK